MYVSALRTGIDNIDYVYVVYIIIYGTGNDTMFLKGCSA